MIVVSSFTFCASANGSSSPENATSIIFHNIFWTELHENGCFFSHLVCRQILSVQSPPPIKCTHFSPSHACLSPSHQHNISLPYPFLFTLFTPREDSGCFNPLLGEWIRNSYPWEKDFLIHLLGDRIRRNISHCLHLPHLLLFWALWGQDPAPSRWWRG